MARHVRIRSDEIYNALRCARALCWSRVHSEHRQRRLAQQARFQEFDLGVSSADGSEVPEGWPAGDGEQPAPLADEARQALRQDLQAFVYHHVSVSESEKWAIGFELIYICAC